MVADDNKKMVALTVRLDKNVYTDFKIATVKQDISIQKCLETFIKDYVEKHK